MTELDSNQHRGAVDKGFWKDGRTATLVLVCLTLGCTGEAPPPPARSAAATELAPAPSPSTQTSPLELRGELFEGLGSHGRRITTQVPEAQRYFDQGLAFVYAFNHDEAIRAFKNAAAADPRSAMAEWGIALANGPHINFPMVPEDRAREAWQALERARALSTTASNVERALIRALEKRHAWPQPADRKPLDEAYATALRDVYRAHPDDADIGALFAEALMDLRPWDLWTATGAPQPGTDEILATLEAVLAHAPEHPLANHLYIHAVEASPHPEKADAAAERLRTLQPGLGHLVHMPTHIDVRRGRWEAAIRSNADAIAADTRYRQLRPKQGFYNLYMAHNRHMLTFAAMMTGQSARALQTIREMVAEMPPAWIQESAAFADGFVGMPFEVLMRFGKWEEILNEPEPAQYLPIARALRLYARGVALAAQNKVPEARAEQALFVAAKTNLRKDAFFGNNSAADLLSVAEKVLAGEILIREGKQAQGILALREAVAAEDRLRYDEPPDWIQPVRHALGAALLKAGKLKDAEAVYRDDLSRLPGNVWSLHGLARSLRLRKQSAGAEKVEAELARASAHADLELTSSCLCLPGL